MTTKVFFLFSFSFFSLIAAPVFSQTKISNDELLEILDLKVFRVPSFKEKQWTIEIITDTLQNFKGININKKLSSKTSSLIAIGFQNDTVLSFNLIRNNSTGSSGILPLKQDRYEIIWNNYPTYLFEDTYVLAKISYEKSSPEELIPLSELLVIQLLKDLKF